MPTVEGIFNRSSPQRVHAVFDIDGVSITFNAIVNPPMPAFSSAKASLTYNSPDQLTGNRQYNGRIGSGDFSLTFANGATLEGQLIAPGVHNAFNVEGYGTWERE